MGGGDEAGRVKAEGGQVLRRGGCEGRRRDESIRSEQASGVGVGGGRAGVTRRGDAGRWVGEARSPLRQAGQFQPMGSRPRRFCKSQPESERSRRSAPTWSRWSTLKNPYLPRESKWSKGNVGGPEVDVSDKNQAVVGEPWGRRRRRRNKETGLSGEPVFFWGWHAGHRQPTAVPVAQIVRKVSTGKKGAKEMHPFEGKQSIEENLCPHPDGRWSKGAWGEDGC